MARAELGDGSSFTHAGSIEEEKKRRLEGLEQSLLVNTSWTQGSPSVAMSATVPHARPRDTYEPSRKEIRSAGVSP